ncbi:MAG: hypothetical protein AB8G95_04180 [Anaerolineae bacterium]
MKTLYLGKIIGRGLILGLAVYLITIFGFEQSASPVSADLVLPPRPEPVVVSPVSVQPSITGAMIKLDVDEALTGDEWTIVQWQDPYTKEWHNTDGWQGELEADGTQMWWVGRELFGKSDFRWQVFASKDGSLMYTSPEFDMPANKQQLVTVTIDVASD